MLLGDSEKKSLRQDPDDKKLTGEWSKDKGGGGKGGGRKGPGGRSSGGGRDSRSPDSRSRRTSQPARWKPPPPSSGPQRTKGGRGRSRERDVAKTNRLYVGNISFDTTWAVLKDHFKKAGEVLKASKGHCC